MWATWGVFPPSQRSGRKLSTECGVMSAQTPQRRLRQAHTPPGHTAPLRQESPVTPQRCSWSRNLIQRNRQLTSQVSTIGVLGAKLTSNKGQGAVLCLLHQPHQIRSPRHQNERLRLAPQRSALTRRTAQLLSPRLPGLPALALILHPRRWVSSTIASVQGQPRDNQTLQYRALTGTPIFCHKPPLRLSPHIHSVLHKLSKLTFLRGLPKGRETTRK